MQPEMALAASTAKIYCIEDDKHSTYMHIVVLGLHQQTLSFEDQGNRNDP